MAQIASDSHVLTRWRDQVLAALPGAFDDRQAQALVSKEAAWEKEREELYAEIGRLSTQLNWLKKNLADCLSLEQRRVVIDWSREEMPISIQAQVLSLSRSGLYYQPIAPSAQEVALKHRIDEIYTAHP